jgi:UDP-N-acetylglucosamine 3-dehydrogenase
VDNRIRLAVFGAGYWGSKLTREYASIENSTGEVKLSYVVDSSQSALDRIRDELSKPIYPSTKPTFSTDYYKALEDKELDAVHIALPNQLHYSVARAALESGKNVLLEKPISTTSREAFKLTRLAEERGLTLLVGHIFRFNNSLRTVKEILRSGKMGKVFYANLNWATFMEKLPQDRDIIFDLAPHPVDVLNFLLDEWPENVDAVGDSYVQKKANAEEMAFVHLEYPDEILASIYLSWIHHGAKERSIKVICEKGTISCDALMQTIRLDYEHESSEIPVFPFDIVDPATANKLSSEGKKQGANNTIRDMQYHFIERIKGRGPELNSGTVGAQTVAVLENITAAMRAGRKLKMQQFVTA